jgi:2-hydroxychromene-2-carboxylate isomerase
VYWKFQAPFPKPFHAKLGSSETTAEHPVTTSSRTVQLYFDPISPYVWLAFKRLDELKAAGLVIDPRPILFAGLLNAHGQKGPAEIPAKRAYIFGDVIRLAAMHGYAFQGPPTHPFNPLRALRMCIAVDDAEQRLRFARALSDACWELGQDLSDRAILDSIANRSGLDAAQLGAAAERPEIKGRLMEATNAAIAAGIFGVPSFVYDKELFWGEDRIDALLWRLKHPAGDNERLNDFLTRGASAERRVPEQGR